MRTTLRILFGALALILGVGGAQAHPHIWVTVTSELLYAPDGSVTAVRHAWTFDDGFSAQALHGVDANRKEAYGREELQPLAEKTLEELKEHAYYTFVKGDDGKHAYKAPIDDFFDYQDGRLTLHFTLPLEEAVKSKTVSVEILDRSFFIDFDMAVTTPVKLVGAPAGCRSLLRPTMGDRKMLHDLSEDSFKEGGANVSLGVLFDNKIYAYCP